MVGGYSPEKVALRRAIGLAIDIDQEIRCSGAGRLCRALDADAQHLWLRPNVLTTESKLRLATGARLLDMYGYVDRTATAGASNPTARRLCCSGRQRPISVRVSATNCAART